MVFQTRLHLLPAAIVMSVEGVKLGVQEGVKKGCRRGEEGVKKG